MSDTGVPLRLLLARPELRLAVLAGHDHLDRDVTWAHSVELADPGPWLSGGELLLTTGLRLPDDAAGRAAYVRRLADAGVAAIGFGTGLSHARVPAEVVDAAARHGLPLLEVPLPTPFVAITKAVMERLAEIQYEGVTRASRIQPRMTRAALRGGPRAVVRELAVSTGARVALVDGTGAVRAAHPDGAAARDLPAAAGLTDGPPAARRPGEGAAAAVRSGPHGAVATQVVRAGPRAHGHLVLAADRPLTAVDHLLLGHAASLIALEAEKPLRLRDERHRVNAMVLRVLLDGAVPAAAAREHLAEAGLPAPDRVRLLVLGGVPQAALLEPLARALAGRGRPLFAVERDGRVLVLLDRGVDAAALVAEAADGLRPRPWAGVSAEHGPGRLAEALREASTAADVARTRDGGDIVGFEEAAGHELLAAPETRAVLERLARTRLAPLTDHDRAHGTDLVATLRAFLEHHGHWEHAAAAVGVHRHTMRGRIERVRALLGTDLDSAQVRAELLLALTAGPGTPAP